MKIARRFWILSACMALLIGNVGLADEGMWLYTSVPKDKIKSRYGFEVTEQWLDHARLSSVRFPGGSGSFVSPDGLAMTNHHIGASCVHQISTKDKDYMKLGFYARTRAEEAKCTNFTVSVLQEIEDITAKVGASLKPGMSPLEASKAQTAAITAMQNHCREATKLNCSPVSFYSGTKHFLYKYKAYNDVRLVFAPEYDMAFFGGDPDNFEFPRYALDVTFVRVYDNGKPLHVENYFKWSRKGAKNNELVFVSGHPGSTQRQATLAQMKFLRDVQYPMDIERLTRSVSAAKRTGSISEANARDVERNLFMAENSLKATKGYYAGLLDTKIMEKIAAEEKTLRDTVRSNPKLKAEFGDPWSDIADYYRLMREGNLYARNAYFGNRSGFSGTLPGMARTWVRWAAEKEKPDAERAREFRNIAAVERRITSPTAVSRDADVEALASSLSDMNKYLPGNTFMSNLFHGRSPEQTASDLIQGTKLDDVEFRKQLLQGGKESLDKSTDPLIVLMRDVESESARVRSEFLKKTSAAEERRRVAAENLARARFAVEGADFPPDANMTLRLSYGAVKGYVENGQGMVPKGTKLSPFTTVGQAFDHAAKHENKVPYKLPDSWLKAKGRIKLKTPLNFVSTNDIIGGNSGSPVVNKKGEIVGLVFDGNIQSLPGRFFFDEGLNRSLSVDSRGIVESLRSVYDAPALANELTGRTMKKK